MSDDCVLTVTDYVHGEVQVINLGQGPHSAESINAALARAGVPAHTVHALSPEEAAKHKADYEAAAIKAQVEREAETKAHLDLVAVFETARDVVASHHIVEDGAPARFDVMVSLSPNQIRRVLYALEYSVAYTTEDE